MNSIDVRNRIIEPYNKQKTNEKMTCHNKLVKSNVITRLTIIE